MIPTRLTAFAPAILSLVGALSAPALSTPAWAVEDATFQPRDARDPIILPPSPVLEDLLKDALARALPGQEIILPEGRYVFRDEITIDQAGITLRGQGKDKTLLDFSTQAGGAQGILGSASGLTLEGFSLRDTPGDAIKVAGVDGVTFRNLGIFWSKKLNPKNGGYGFYPVLSRNILIEDCEVVGASDSGVYVGQSQNIIVRRVYAHHNVAGIEIENSRYADVTENEVTQNTAGILVFDLPDLPTQGGRQTRVFKNHVFENNGRNFSVKGNILNLVPPGVGILVLANDDVEVFANRIEKHRLTGIAVDHFGITERPVTDASYDSKPERIFIHDNLIQRSNWSFFDGTKLNFLVNILFGLQSPDILVDGIEDGTYSGAVPPPDRKICIRGNTDEKGRPASFGNMHLDHQQKLSIVPGGPVTRDLGPHDCAHDSLPAVALDRPLPLPPAMPPLPADVVARICAGGGTGVNWLALATVDCPDLSDYRLFQDARDPTRNAAEGGTPYELTTPLFTDYATKSRFVFLPPGQPATFRESLPFEFPIGTVIAKSFSYNGNPIETRLLVRRLTRWVALPYRWRRDGSNAALNLGGGVQSMLYVDPRGKNHRVEYQIPGQAKCATCHGTGAALSPIGPKAKFLNRSFDFGSGPENQLVHWVSSGLLAGAPADPSAVPAIPPWDDPQAGTLEQRAKGYLEINCAHCHNPAGWARNTGLYLEAERETGSTSYGHCKPPVAAGAGTGGRLHDIVPGQPERSILVYRLDSSELSSRMPQLGRSMVHAEGASLVRAWVKSLPKETCE